LRESEGSYAKKDEEPKRLKCIYTEPKVSDLLANLKMKKMKMKKYKNNLGKTAFVKLIKL
jgi:hypothetical protein